MSRPSRHANFYRVNLPPLLRVLGWTLTVYTGLQLTWTVLNQREEKRRWTVEWDKAVNEVRESIADRTKESSQGVPSAGNDRADDPRRTLKSRPWWKLW